MWLCTCATVSVPRYRATPTLSQSLRVLGIGSLCRGVFTPNARALRLAMAVAHCLVGQARTLSHPVVFQNYKAHAVDPLGVASELFFVLDTRDKRFDLDGDQPTAAALRWLVPRKVVFSNLHQHGKWAVCLALIEDAEALAARTYSFIIKTRPDLVVLADLPPVSLFPRGRVLWARPYREFWARAQQAYPQVSGNATEDFQRWTLPKDKVRKRRQGRIVSDLILVFPRELARSVLGGPMRLRAGRQNGSVFGDRELYLRVKEQHVSVQFKPFEVRILRDANYSFCRHSRNLANKPGKFYNSLCV